MGNFFGRQVDFTLNQLEDAVEERVAAANREFAEEAVAAIAGTSSESRAASVPSTPVRWGPSTPGTPSTAASSDVPPTPPYRSPRAGVAGREVWAADTPPGYWAEQERRKRQRMIGPSFVVPESPYGQGVTGVERDDMQGNNRSPGY